MPLTWATAPSAQTPYEVPITGPKSMLISLSILYQPFHQTLSVGGAMEGGPTPAPAMPSTWSNAASTSVSPSAQLPSTPYATSRNTNTQKRTVQSLDWK